MRRRAANVFSPTLRYENNLWWNLGPDYDPETTTFEDIIQLTTDDDGNTCRVTRRRIRNVLADYLRDNGNIFGTESPIVGIDRGDNGFINSFNPLVAGDATAPPAPSEFGHRWGKRSSYQSVDYHGAFGSENWAAGWTLLSQTGELE